ncbi:hypothetical protein [Noviherbaspirillum pedocola]|uniref:Uncharacterized protein n=1 Tax=Noviherbaspirillum pedocola TaxID=2801341 RepID=A0A934T008_9BURK|nr:hypothetical protein [Noviherbaspirillum pedocola]MBK4738455.1 hypothetical protein [Noviherbaspirillum pedocola]
MTITSKPLYVYLQRPDNGEWTIVGRYKPGASSEGVFQYAPSYVDQGHAWTIDPVNLPFMPGRQFAAALQYLQKAGNFEGWGALAVGSGAGLPGCLST